MSNDVRPIATVLILATNDVAANKWADDLRKDGFAVWIDGQAPAPDAEVEVVLTDGKRTPIEDYLSQRGFADLPTGIVGIGSDASGDVRLPRDASPREISLACRLLAENVRLRRQLRADREERRHLSDLAFSDHLTGLPNRRAWDEAFHEMRARAQSTGQTLTVAIYDLDHFKPINDVHGHDVGDQVLRAAAAALRDALRGDDFVARLGGDEFGVLLTGLCDSNAPNVVERARQAVPARLAKAELPVVTASAACCDVQVDGDNLTSDSASIACADEALRCAKAAGGNRTECVDCRK